MLFHISYYILYYFDFGFDFLNWFNTIRETTEIAAIMPTLFRTVVASLGFVTFESTNSGCNSVARCTALATLDSARRSYTGYRIGHTGSARARASSS